MFANQAPPSFREIFEQRRRWIAGNHQEAVVLALVTFAWFVVGLQFYALPRTEGVVGFALAPVASLVHSIGVVVGLVSPPDDFRVTRKIPRNEWKGGGTYRYT